MAQFWHAHWAEDSFKSTRLQNWEVPRWHAEWPDRHCTTTTFIAHQNGRVYPTSKPSKVVWSNFKGTWELPLKIDRRTAEKLSKNTEYKKVYWNYHYKTNERLCKNACIGINKQKCIKNKIKSKNQSEDEQIKEEKIKTNPE